MPYEPKIDWSVKTGMMLGRFQPWNQGHSAMFKQIAGYRLSNLRDKDKFSPKQIIIMVRHQPYGQYSYEEICKQIIDDLEPEYHNMYEIMKVPNIENIFMGRQVGFDVERVNLRTEDEPVEGKKKLTVENDYYWHTFWKGRAG